MDVTLAAVIAVAVLALVVIVASLRYRKRNQFDFKGPFSIGLSLDASNDQAKPTRSQSSVEIDSSNVTAANIYAGHTVEGHHNVPSVDRESNVSIRNNSTVNVKGDIQAGDTTLP